MKAMKNVKRFVATCCTLAMSVSLLAACSSKEAAPSSQPAAGSSSAPMKLTFLMPGYNPSLPNKNSPILKKLQEATNVEIDPQWVASSAFDDKFNITLASGSLPPLIVSLFKSPSFVNAARTGAFWELGPYLKDYPNLSQANPIVLNNISIDGKIYSLYRARPLGRNGISYRKDWLDSLGMKEPKTTDDFYNMLKTFKNSDPDGNGKNDTVPLLLSKEIALINIMQVWFGVPNGWGDDGTGKLVPAHLTPEYMNALQFFRKLYKEQLINADFAILDPNKLEDTMANGKYAVTVGVADVSTRVEDKILLQHPDLKGKTIMGAMGSVEGPKGLRSLPTSGYNGMIAISKTAVKTEADLKKVLTFLDKINDKDLQNLLVNGVEGRHYTLENGGVVPSKDDAIMSEVNSLSQMLTYLPEERQLKPVQTPIRQKVQEVYNENLKIVVANPAEPLISNVYAQKGSQLDTIINDARVKYIVGQIDDAGLQQAIDLWKKSGGDDYVKEINELYSKLKK